MSRILVVDDSPIDRRLAGGLLEKQGLKVSYAQDGADALQSIRNEVPTLVLTDMQMPEVDGLQLVQQLRVEFPHLPAILMTARGSEEIAVAALQQGAAGYVAKRSLGTELTKVVQGALRQIGEQQTTTSLMSRLDRRSERFVVENDVQLLMSMARYLQQTVAEFWQLPTTESLRIGTALEEAILNALYHGNLEVSSSLKEVDHAQFYLLAEQRMTQQPYAERRVKVDLAISHDDASISIEDDGPGFDVSSLPDPTLPMNLDRPCGRGVLLIRAFMDDVQYTPKGNRVTLVKRRRR